MKTLILFCLLMSLSFADSAQDCGDIPVQSAVYNLCTFSNAPPFNVSNPNFTGGLSFTLGTAHSPSCDGHESIWATYYAPQCIDLALEDPSYRQINESEPEQGIVITFPEVEEIQQDYQLVVVLTCDKDISDVNDVQFQVISSDTLDGVTTVTVAGASRYGCPVLFFGQLVNFLERNRQVFAIVFGLLGICLLLFGSKLFNAAIFMITTLIGTLLISTLIFEFTDFGTKLWVLWTIFGVSLMVGLISGYLALKSVRFGFFVVGAALGVVGGLVIYNALILPFLKVGSGTIALYITIIACGLVAGVVSVIISRSIIIIATSAIGAYLLVRAVSVFIGGFPAETYVAQGTEKFSPIVYAYLVAMALLAGAGIYYQHKSSKAPKQTQEPVEVYYRYE